MTLLATVEDFFRARGEDPPLEAEHESVMRALLALRVASDVARAHCGRRFDYISTTVAVDGTGSQDLLLPNPPIAEVTDVTLVANDGSETELDPTEYRLNASPGILHRLNSVWPKGWLNVEITLVSGYLLPTETPGSGPEATPLPDDLQGAVISVASRLYASNANAGVGDLTSVTLDGYSETYSSAVASAQDGLSTLELATLERYRVVRVA